MEDLSEDEEDGIGRQLHEGVIGGVNPHRLSRSTFRTDMGKSLI
jgi:hypothetical protein